MRLAGRYTDVSRLWALGDSVAEIAADLDVPGETACGGALRGALGSGDCHPPVEHTTATVSVNYGLGTKRRCAASALGFACPVGVAAMALGPNRFSVVCSTD